MPRFRLHRDAYRDALRVGRLSIEFQRTLRIPDDGNVYPLPPGLGTFPIRRVRDYARRVPASWRERGGYFVPMYQREALWILFRGPDWRLNAVKVGVGGVNAVSGKQWDATLRSRPQDYLVVPDQPWLDGINAGAGFIRQIVAMPLGEELTLRHREMPDGGRSTIKRYNPSSDSFARVAGFAYGSSSTRPSTNVSCSMAIVTATAHMSLSLASRKGIA